MNEYGPRQLADADGTPTGRYHYTRKHDGDVWAIGYCAGDCAGHATPAEAEEHYRQYQIDHADLDSQQWIQDAGCQVCGALTRHYAVLGEDSFSVFTLCNAHRTKDTLQRIVRSPGSYSSTD